MELDYSRQLIDEPLTEDIGSCRELAFSPDGKTLASGSRDETIILWDVNSPNPSASPSRGISMVCTAWPSARMARRWLPAAETNHHPVGRGNPQAHRRALDGHTASVYSVAFSPDGKTLASGSGDKTIILWDVATRSKPIGEPLTGHTDTVNSVAFSPDGKTLASGSDDDTIILWDVATANPIGEPLDGHIGACYSVAFSPDGKTLASGSGDTPSSCGT